MHTSGAVGRVAIGEGTAGDERQIERRRSRRGSRSGSRRSDAGSIGDGGSPATCTKERAGVRVAERQRGGPGHVAHAGNGPHFPLDVVDRTAAAARGSDSSIPAGPRSSSARSPRGSRDRRSRPRAACAAAGPRRTAGAPPSRPRRPRASRAGRRGAPVVVRLSDAIAACCRRDAVACHAGARPNSSPTTSAAAAQNATTRASNDSVTPGGSRSGGIAEAAAFRMTAPAATPRTPPMSDSIRLSVSSWRTTRRRSAPSADRIASSRVRAVARASSRLATFAQQISSTKPTTPRKSSDVWRSSAPITASCSGSSAAPRPGVRLRELAREPGRSRRPCRRPPARGSRRASAVRSPAGSRRPAPAAAGGPCDTIAHMLVRPSSCASSGATPTTV